MEIIIAIVVIYVLVKIPEWRANNYIPKSGHLDWAQMNYDSAMGKKEGQINADILKGKYDKK